MNRTQQNTHLTKQALMSIWPMGLLLMHFSLFRIGYFEFTIGTMVSLYVVMYLMANARIKAEYLLIVLAMLIYTLVFGFFAKDLMEFSKSFILLCNLLLLSILCSNVELPNTRLLKHSVSLFLRLSVVVALLVIAQFILLNVFGSYALMSPYGPFSSLGPGYMVYEPQALSLIKRPNGIFSEPSVAGWFLAFATSVAVASPILRGKTAWPIAVICGVAAIATLSISTLVNIALLSLVSVRVIQKSARKKAVLIGLVVLVLILLGWVIVAANIASRAENLFVQGTSMYYRLVAPIMLLSDSIVEFPFGHPVGQTDYIAEKPYMVNWEYGSRTNIDNSFLMISYYFGFLGIALSLSAIAYAIYLFLKRSYATLIIVVVLLALAETGALWSPNMALLIGYSIILIRYIRHWERRYMLERGKLVDCGIYIRTQ